jgi:hypothetical protein
MSVTPKALLASSRCLYELSKNAQGQVVVLSADLQSCAQPACESLVLIQLLRADLSPHDCDSSLARFLDGRLVAWNLTMAYTGPTESHRGVHAADFYWKPFAGGAIVGTLEGTTNAGIARAPVFPRCETCESCREIEVHIGHLFGTGQRVPGIRAPAFEIEAVYRFTWDPTSKVDSPRPVVGTLEGVVILPCA